MWKVRQTLGDVDAAEHIRRACEVTSVDVSDSCEFVVVGDRSGRVVLFESIFSTGRQQKPFNYSFTTEFQIHRPSLHAEHLFEVPAALIGIKVIRESLFSKNFLVGAADGLSIWELSRREAKKYVALEHPSPTCSGRMVRKGKSFTPVLWYTFPSVHALPIRSISLSRQQTHAISTDKKHAYMYNIAKAEKVLPLLTRPPDKRLTVAEFSMVEDVGVYAGGEDGSVTHCDLRVSPDRNGNLLLADDSAACFEENFSILGLADGPGVLVGRTSDCVKIWDIRRGNAPLHRVKLTSTARHGLKESFLSRISVTFDSLAMRVVTSSPSPTFFDIDINEKRVKTLLLDDEASQVSVVGERKFEDCNFSTAPPAFSRHFTAHSIYRPQANLLVLAVGSRLSIITEQRQARLPG